jgi:putative N6-adenine-specific DNA methylase
MASFLLARYAVQRVHIKVITPLATLSNHRPFHCTPGLQVRRKHRRDTALERRSSVDINYYKQHVKQDFQAQSRTPKRTNRRNVRATFVDRDEVDPKSDTNLLNELNEMWKDDKTIRQELRSYEKGGRHIDTILPVDDSKPHAREPKGYVKKKLSFNDKFSVKQTRKNRQGLNINKTAAENGATRKFRSGMNEKLENKNRSVHKSPEDQAKKNFQYVSSSDSKIEAPVNGKSRSDNKGKLFSKWVLKSSSTQKNTEALEVQSGESQFSRPEPSDEQRRSFPNPTTRKFRSGVKEKLATKNRSVNEGPKDQAKKKNFQNENSSDSTIGAPVKKKSRSDNKVKSLKKLVSNRSSTQTKTEELEIQGGEWHFSSPEPSDEQRKNFSNSADRSEKPNRFQRSSSPPREQRYPPDHLNAVVSCHPGLQPFLEEELKLLGIKHKMDKQNCGAILLHPKFEDILHCHLYLGTASNVYLHMGHPFRARALGELTRRVSLIPWGTILHVPEKSELFFKLQVSAALSRLIHTTAIRDHVLEGIFIALKHPDPKKQLADHNAKVKNMKDDELPFTHLKVHIFRDEAQISIVTSETPIHQRTYRLETCKAPLREDLAFAFLWAAGWKPAYHLPGGKINNESPLYTSLLDPFCGSGTIPIEAACMASGLAPGRLRPPPLKGTTLYNPKLWKNMVTKALEISAAVDSSNIKILASDRDKGAAKATLANAARAGVHDMIEVQDCAFTKHPWLDGLPTMENFLLVGNLPFGKRTRMPANKDRKHDLLPMYQSLATVVNKFMDKKLNVGAMFLTDNRDLVRMAGFKTQFKAALDTKSGGTTVKGMRLELPYLIETGGRKIEPESSPGPHSPGAESSQTQRTLIDESNTNDGKETTDPMVPDSLDQEVSTVG